MDRDQITSAYVGISKLMDVGHVGAGNRTFRTLAGGVLSQASFFVVSKNRLRHQTLLNANHSVRTIVIVDWRLLSGPPTNDQHLDCLVATNAMAPVITLLESEVRLQIELGDLDCLEPGANFCERRRCRLAVEFLDQRRKGKRGAIERLSGLGSFSIDLCRQELGSPGGNRGQTSYMRFGPCESRTQRRFTRGMTLT